jgi:hypothetical protein
MALGRMRPDFSTGAAAFRQPRRYFFLRNVVPLDGFGDGAFLVTARQLSYQIERRLI